MGHVQRRAQIAVEGLHLREAKAILQRRQSRLRKALGDEGEDRGRLGQNALVGYQCRSASFGIDGEIFRLALLIAGEADPRG